MAIGYSEFLFALGVSKYSFPFRAIVVGVLGFHLGGEQGSCVF